MYKERNKFLTEVMGLKATYLLRDYKTQLDQFANKLPDFSTWEGFGKLFKFCQKQEWWDKFEEIYLITPACGYTTAMQFEYFINPDNSDNFANAVYEFLKERM